MLQFIDAAQEVVVWLKRLNQNQTVTVPIIKRLMNEAIKAVYPMAIAADPDFFATKASFGSTALLAFPSDYRATLLIECTDTDCSSGFAIPTARRSMSYVVESDSIGPTASDPIYVLTGAGIVIDPARQGNHYYLKTVGDITDDTTDLETIIPWLWIETVILKTMELARLHSAQQPEEPTGIEKGLRMVDMAHQSLKSAFQPLKLFNQPVPEPAFANLSA